MKSANIFYQFYVRASLVIAICMTIMGTSTVQAEDDLPPEITYFSWYNPMGNYFVFYGTILDEQPQGCTIALGGVLRGYYTSVDETGYFYIVAELPDDTMGDVDAIAVDAGLQVSEPVGTFVFF